MSARVVLFLLLNAALSLPAGAQQIYRWVDAHGKVQYTAEKPPASARQAAPLESRISAVGRNGAPADAAAAKAAALAERPAVTMFSTSWCPFCRKAREYFAANKIPYTELDVEQSREALERFRSIGGKNVPVFLVGAQQLNGYNEQRIGQLLRASGY